MVGGIKYGRVKGALDEGLVKAWEDARLARAEPGGGENVRGESPTRARLRELARRTLIRALRKDRGRVARDLVVWIQMAGNVYTPPSVRKALRERLTALLIPPAPRGRPPGSGRRPGSSRLDRAIWSRMESRKHKAWRKSLRTRSACYEQLVDLLVAEGLSPASASAIRQRHHRMRRAGGP